VERSVSRSGSLVSLVQALKSSAAVQAEQSAAMEESRRLVVERDRTIAEQAERLAAMEEEMRQQSQAHAEALRLRDVAMEEATAALKAEMVQQKKSFQTQAQESMDRSTAAWRAREKALMDLVTRAQQQ